MDFGEIADEAGFLWGQWERMLQGGASTLVHFVDGLDERLLACEEVLGRAPVNLLRERFAAALDGDGEENEVAVWALALMVSGAPEDAATIPQALETHPQHRGQLARVLEICWTELDGALVGWLRTARSAPAVAALLGALAFRAVKLGTELDPFLRSDDDQVLAAALGCLRSAAAPDLRSVDQALRSAREPVRRAALETALLLEPRLALSELRQDFDRRRGAVDLGSIALAVAANPADLERLRQAADDPAHRRQALWALGMSGWIEAAEICLRAVSDEKVRDLAVEGFEAISGIRLASAPPTEVKGDDEATEAPPAATPWTAPPFVKRPAVEMKQAASAWSARKGSLGTTSGRLWAGAPLTGEALEVALRREPLRRRHARAFELDLRSKGDARLQTRTWGWQQTRALGRLRVPPRVSCQTGLDKGR